MRNLLVLFAAFTAILSAQYKATPAQPAADIPATLTGQLAPGVQVADSAGKPFCEIWLTKTAPSGPKTTEDAVTLPTVPQGAFVGVIRFDGQGADRRGQPIKPGVYTLRYAWMPVSGDHQGAAPQRDFALMIPVAEDKTPGTVLPVASVIELSRKASGTPHPAVLSLSSGSGTAGLTKEGDHDWTLNTKLGDQPVAIILIGKAEG